MRGQESGMFSWTKRSKRSFHAENLKRQQKPYIAPGRGWYHIYTFRLGRPEEVSLDWLPDYPGETLALVRLDIRDYASRELDTLALDFAEQIFRAFQERKKEMIHNPKHLVLMSAHPSPLSAYRGFFGSHPFSRTNEYLEENGLAPIDWQIENVIRGAKE